MDRRFETLAFGVAPGQRQWHALSRSDAAFVREVVQEGQPVSRLEGTVLKVGTAMADPHSRLIATTLVCLPTADVRAQMGLQTRLAVVVAVIVLFIGGLVSILLARRVTGPVARLTAASASVEAGRFELASLDLARLVGPSGRVLAVHSSTMATDPLRSAIWQTGVEELRESLEALVSQRVVELPHDPVVMPHRDGHPTGRRQTEQLGYLR
jgi:hypothetical protein